MKIFLDTEFTDFVRPQLISLGMVSSDGKEFYAEIPYRYDECSDFVRQAVLPLLGRFPCAIHSKEGLNKKLLEWLTEAKIGKEYLEIYFDSQNDWDLFIEALSYKVPKWCKQKNINGSVDEILFKDYLHRNNLQEHHALNDAKANKFAYRD